MLVLGLWAASKRVNDESDLDRLGAGTTLLVDCIVEMSQQ